MKDLIEALRDVLGDPSFWEQFTTNNSYNTWQWNYGAMLEYICGTIILGIVICQVFKFLRCLVK